MELLDICLTATYFQFEDKFYQQKEGLEMGNSLHPVVSLLYIYATLTGNRNRYGRTKTAKRLIYVKST
jgi:hypothetical protein